MMRWNLIYRVEIAWPDTEAYVEQVQFFLNQELGEGRWLCGRTITPVLAKSDKSPELYIIICAAHELLALKWADIRDGVCRLQSITSLKSKERRAYRSCAGNNWLW